MRFLLLILSLFIARIDVIAQNLELQSIVPYERDMSDIWGWSHDDKEYALVATTHYFSIVDVTDPENPVKLHQIEGPNGGPGSYWREMKTYGNYAYGVHDGANLGGQNHGLVIVDLSMLPEDISTTFWSNDANETLEGPFTRAHNIFIDEHGFAYLVGHNLAGRGVIILDLNQDPLNPPVVGRYNDNYVHDCFVRDNILWTAEVNVGDFAAIDVSDKSNLVTLARQSTIFQFTHHVWLSDDDKTLFTTDERSGAPISAYDVSDLNDIELLDIIKSGQNVIPHNAFVFGDFVVASYYREGVIILDASKPDILVKVGQYDTSPLSGNGFNGCWGVYPYLPSGNIIASDIEGGLYVFKPNYVHATYILGNVTSIEDNTPISFASVSIKRDSTISDQLATISNGDFKEGYLNGGEFNITVEKDGFHPFTESYTVNGESTLEVDIQLIPIGYTIRDSIYADLTIGNSIQVCDEDVHGIDFNSVISCDNQFNSSLGTWTIDANGCLNYTSNSTSGEDIICFEVKDTISGVTNTNYVVISIADTVTAIEINGFENGGLEILQNPVDKTLLLKNNIVIRAPLLLNIYNMSGQLIESIQEKGKQSQFSIDVEQLSKGFYVLEVKSENGSLGQTKFIKN